MSKMGEIYYQLVKFGRKTIEEVPEKLREEVIKRLEEDGEIVREN